MVLPLPYGVLHLEDDRFKLSHYMGAEDAPHPVGDLRPKRRADFYSSHTAHATEQDDQHNQSQNTSE
jgi:hypothetical protein